MMVLAAPLALGACVAENNSMKTAALAKKGEAAKPTGGPDAYGYAPVKLAALADGARIALPSSKPDWQRLQAASAGPAAPAAAPASTPAAIVAKAPVAAPNPASPEGAAPVDEIAALKADVEERKANLVVMADGKGDRVVPAADASAASAAGGQAVAAAPVAKVVPTVPPSRIAQATNLIDPRNSVPAAISAAAYSADAVKVAAIDTTAKAIDVTARAIDVVQDRIGDTFKGEDTVTGSASIDRMIETAAMENNIPTELAYAVVRVESHYNPTAIGGGAYGLSQIKPATARGLGFDGPAKGLLNPETNLRYGMKYLAGAWELSGHDVCGTAMRYKGGHRTKTMSRSAAAYCSNVKRHMAAIERRRAPAREKTVIAANAHGRAIPAARALDTRARARLVAATAAPEAAPSADVAAANIATVAASGAGRAVTAGVPVPARAATIASNADANRPKSGRVRVYSEGEAAPAASTIASNDRFGFAE